MKKIFCFLFIVSLSILANAEDVKTVPFVDLNKYSGTWFEVASIPQSFQKKCVKNTTANYKIIGNNKVQVLNSCAQADGTLRKAVGQAKIKDTMTNSKLRVSFVKLFDYIFAFGGNYWILDLSSDYSYALIGDPSRKYSWILSRTPYIDQKTVARALKSLKANGYDTCALMTSVQDNGFNSRVPLCTLASLN